MALRTDEKGAGEYGREALSQFRDAARYGAKALAERKAAAGASKGAAALKERAAGGGAAAELGELADAALARFGKKGKLASKLGVGHRLVDRLLPDQDEELEEEPDAPEPEAEEAEDEEESAGDEHLCAA